MVLREILRLCLGREEESDLIDDGRRPRVMEGRWHACAGTYYVWIYEAVVKGLFGIWHPVDIQ